MLSVWEYENNIVPLRVQYQYELALSLCIVQQTFHVMCCNTDVSWGYICRNIIVWERDWEKNYGLFREMPRKCKRASAAVWKSIIQTSNNIHYRENIARVMQLTICCLQLYCHQYCQQERCSKKYKIILKLWTKHFRTE